MSSFVVWSPLNTAKQESLCPCRSNEQKAGHNIYKTFPVAFTPAPSWSSKPDGSWYIAWENSWHFATPPLGSACFWLVEGYFQFSTNRSTCLIWVVTDPSSIWNVGNLFLGRHFAGKLWVVVASRDQCRLFSQASWYTDLQLYQW